MVEKNLTVLQNKEVEKDTIAIMVSIGPRTWLTDHTFGRLALWAASHGYSSMLVKKNLTDTHIAPHFNKLIAHRHAPGFKYYIIVDDDLMLKKGAPPIETVPDGMIGLCNDAVQSLTQAGHVAWTANTGFIVAGQNALGLLEEAYQNGEYPFNCWDASGQGIWGPHDQAALNNVLFLKGMVHKLDWRWNYQAVIAFYAGQGNGWQKWQKSRLHRLKYYLSLLNPLSKNKQMINKCYGLHMTMGPYPAFFSRIHK
jgi:hypothetical protein